MAQVSTNGDLTIWSINSLAALFSTKIVEKDASVDQSKVRHSICLPELNTGALHHVPAQCIDLLCMSYLQVARVSWKPDGSVLGLPGSRFLRILHRGTWKQTQVDSAQTEAHTQDITYVARILQTLVLAHIWILGVLMVMFVHVFRTVLWRGLPMATGWPPLHLIRR